MSLFACREWWSANDDSASEECGHNCMWVGNINNNSSSPNNIIIGSYSGLLRIYQPKTNKFTIEDLLYESKLDQPILGINVGRYLPESSHLALAILHPRKLMIYITIDNVDGQGETRYLELEKRYEHQLERTSYNFIHGSFGGVEDRDFICVQSMDGQLSFFENDNFAFSRYLPDTITPGPICYISNNDSIVVTNSSMHIINYKYHVLGATRRSAILSERKSKTNNITPQWSLNIGDHAIDIVTNKDGEIIVLSEHTIFHIRNNGSIRSQHRIEYNPSTCLLFENIYRHDCANQMIVATYQNTFMIYQDKRLAWAAKCMILPEDACIVSIKVAKFGDIDGMIVALDDAFNVYIFYLGTEPPEYKINETNEPQLDYETMDIEHRKLLKTIREHSSMKVKEPQDKININTSIDNNISIYDGMIYEDEENWLCNDNDEIIGIMTKIFLTCSGNEHGEIENIRLGISTPNGILCNQSEITIPKLIDNSTPISINVFFGCSKQYIPKNFQITIVASHMNINGHPRTVSHIFELPFYMCGIIVPPMKNPRHMITLDTNASPPSLIQLFNDLIQPALIKNPELERTSAVVMTFKYHAENTDATILVSKKAGRYRIQSNDFHAIYPLTIELCRRLRSHFHEKKDFSITFKDKIPLDSYYQIIDSHFNYRQELQLQYEKAEKLSLQYRAIEKRLLTRFKNKNPVPLNHLDDILENTSEKLLQCTVDMNDTQQNANRVGSNLEIATSLILLLLKLRCELDENSFNYLSSHLIGSALVSSTNINGEGWEERTELALSHLLKTSLQGKNKERNIAHDIKLSISKLNDTQKLKKKIRQFCDRLVKGIKPKIS